MNDFHDELAALRGDPHVFQPRILTFGEEVKDLVRSGAIALVSDEILLQLTELVQTRAVGTTLTDAAVQERIAQHLKDVPLQAYGHWVHYPWSRRLVHVLPKEEYRFLRTNRNRNKISDEEQKKLLSLTIGVVGLSVGQATAITLALEGVGTHFRLADFDHLGLTNMNRLRAGVQALGINKAVLTAREIFEMDPYATIEIFREGVTEANIDAFLDGLDMVFEECDDFGAKVIVRERARKKRIPVLMETSDRGLIDIERFDLEPDRPIFHGLIQNIDANRAKNLTAFEKMPIVYDIIGRTMTKRSMASLVDIETTLVTWPQLASGVALGAALNTDAARRIALGTFRESGRFFVDLEQLVADGTAVPHVPTPRDDGPAQGKMEPLPSLQPSTAPTSTRMDRDTARALVAYGTLAPSGGNCQPWRFGFRDGVLTCFHDRKRGASKLNFQDVGSYVALGALTRNLELAAAELGLDPKIVRFPQGLSPGADEEVICTVESSRTAHPAKDPLAQWMTQRVTNRKLGPRPRPPLHETHRQALADAASRAGARLQFVEGDALTELGRVFAEDDRIRLTSQSFHHEMMRELRWTRAEADSTRDGIELSTLELTPADRVGMQITRDWAVMSLLRQMNAGQGIGRMAVRTLAGTSAIGLLTIQGTDAKAFYAGGSALQDVWLTATQHELSFQPMSAILALFARLERGAGEGLTPVEREEAAVLRARYRQIFSVGPDESEVLLFRISYAGRPSARSLRRWVDDVLTF